MVFPEFIKNLEKRLSGPLPGQKVQTLMSPTVQGGKGSTEQQFDGTKKGSVLILLYPEEGNVFLPLMQRPDYDGVHGGQISLPGGKMEAKDADLIATAIRETEEEIGVTGGDIQVIGQLTKLHVFASNFMVSPVVAYTTKKPHFIPNRYEVEKIISADLSKLLDESLIKSKEIMARGRKIHSPYFDVQGHVVWGATAMMLSEFLFVVKEILGNRS